MIDQHRSVQRHHHRRSPLLERPDQEGRPLLVSGRNRGDGIPSARSSFVNAPVQQPLVGSSVLVDTLSSASSRALDVGNRRKGLLNTPSKVKSESIEKNSTVNQDQPMCVSCKSKLRLNERGEYCCRACGKLQLRSAVSITSLVGRPLLRQRTGSVEPDDSMAHRMNGESGNGRKLPALLDLPSSMYPMGPQSSPMPLISFPNNVTAFIPTTSAPTSLFALMTPSHRILYPSEEKAPQPQSLFATSLQRCNGTNSKKLSKSSASDRSSNRHHPYQRADYVRGADLKLPTTSNKNGRNPSGSKRGRNTVNKGTVTDVNKESDLGWLCRQRASIDRRIAQLQQVGTSAIETDVQGLEAVTYITGYYCHVCRKFLRGNFNAKIAHCREQDHVNNLAKKDDSGTQPDADSLFKYYEEKYEIAFDGDDPGPITDLSASAIDSNSSQHEEYSVLDEASEDSTRNDDSMDEPEDGLAPEAPMGAIPDSDDDLEESLHRERFDRTKISR